MRQIIVVIALSFSLVLPPESGVAGSCRQRAVVVNTQRSIVVSNGLTVVPFAVPVAVPVATISRPTLFYAYRDYSQPAASQQQTSNDLGASVEKPTPPTKAVPAQSAAVDILRRNCATCHSGEAAHGGLRIFQGTGNIFERLPRHVILEMVAPGADGKQEMPPGDRPKLSPVEVDIIRDWAKLPRNAVY